VTSFTIATYLVFHFGIFIKLILSAIAFFVFACGVRKIFEVNKRINRETQLDLVNMIRKEADTTM